LVKVGDVPACSGCPLAAKFPNAGYVPVKWGEGNRLVVGEAAGADEELQGKPFVGKSGQVLQGLYRKAGVDWTSLTVVNTLSCRPPSSIYPTSADARSYCTKEEAQATLAHCKKAHLDPVLKGREWTRIDALGEHALEAVTGKQGISKWRGMPLEPLHRPGEPIVVPTLHPAFLMREQAKFPVVVSDLKKSLVQPPEYYNLYPSIGDLQDFEATEFAFDLECNRFNHNEIYLCGLSSKRFEAIVVPWKGPYVKELRRIFAAATVLKGQNILGFDLPVLEANGILAPNAEIRDIMLMQHLLQPDLDHDLEFIASLFTNKPAWKHLASQQKEYYNAVDTDVVSQIEPQLWALLRQEGLTKTYTHVSVPIAKIVAQMTKRGVKVDVSQISKVRERIKEEQAKLELQLPASLQSHKQAVNRRIPAPPGTLGKSGKPVKYVNVPSSESVVPWRSDKSVGKWLYEDLKLPVQKHIKTGKQSTDKYSLERLAKSVGDEGSKRGILAVKELRSLDETLTTFAKEKVEFGTSIHPHFSVHGTNSGRLSSSGPNAQNIPEALRVIYIPNKPDHYIVQADFSGIENRLTAHLAHDTERLARFSDPSFSEHKWACEKFFGIPMGEVQKSSDPDSAYSKAKHIVHGSNYGLGARKMSLMYGVKESEVKQLLGKWKASIPKTFSWQEYTAGLAKVNGVLANPFGRKRWFGTSSYYTESLAFLPQSTAADIILRCMVGLVWDRIAWPEEAVMEVCPVFKAMPAGTNLLIQVHDSLVFECPKRDLDKVVATLRLVMQQPWPILANFSCPVEVQFGPSWGDLEVYK
jgi:uracil-DNA glycosylase family 4